MTQTLALSAGNFVVPENVGVAQLKTGLSGSTANIQLVRSNGVALPFSGATFTPSSYAQAPGFNYNLLANGSNVINNSVLNFSEKNDTLVIASKTSKTDDNKVAIASKTAYNKVAIASNSIFNFGDGDNTLQVKGGASNLTVYSDNGVDNISVQGSVLSAGVNIQTGSANDTVTIGGTATNSTINTATGSDTIRVAGNVTNSTFNAGTGADVLVFGGTAKTNVAINLGGADGAIDRITFNKAGVTLNDLSGVKITGASNGDLLIIGSTQFTYNSAANSWVNGGTRLTF